MRRKSERTANKKVKSPEKKLEKVKRTRTRRRKQSTSSEESAEEATPVVEPTPPAEAEQNPPKTPVKEDSPEETPEQVWQVKTTEPADMGEIQKLKICLTRPPSTPERSPRSKRKHSRATSSSDTPSADGSEEKKKKHRSRRGARESKEEDSDKPENQTKQDSPKDEAPKHLDEVTQSSETIVSETPISTATIEEDQSSQEEVQEQASAVDQKDEDNKTESKPSDADTTVNSPKEKTTENDDAQAEEKESLNKSEPKAEITIHASSSLVEEVNEELKQEPRSTALPPVEPMDISLEEVSKFDRNVSDDVTNEPESTEIEEKSKATNKTNDVVESSTSVETDTPAKCNDSQGSERNTILPNDPSKDEKSVHQRKSLDRSDSTLSQKNLDHSDSTQEEVPNGQAPPIVINRKRRWGSRPNKATPQKSIAISTDILKEIIPDVKPTEFEEVIEERKIHKRVEIPEKFERPILPKIIIDNSENVEQLRKENEEKDIKEKSLSVNRKISIVKENDSIITHPPSPPRHKQSNILFITNLVRPFTLMQLKNLLLRTGKIVEDGFWIDKIKSKCFVQYEDEEQAVETRHALHGVTWPVSNPKTLQVDFSTKEAFDKAKSNVETEATQASAIPGTVEDWLREQDLKRERGEQENLKPWERKAGLREWDVGKNEKDKEKENQRRDERMPDKIRRHRSIERSPEPARKFKKKEEEAPSKLLDDLFRKTKTTPCIYWLPLSAETIAIKEEQRRAHMAENERRLLELRNRRRH